MLLKVDFSKEIFRLIYNQLYNRVLEFALENEESENLVTARFVSLVANDPSVLLLVNAMESGVNAHCLLLFQQMQRDVVGVFVEQMVVDSKHDETFVRECIDYVESLPEVARISMFTDENKYKAFRKKYEFEVSKVLMYRTVKRD